MNSNCLKGFKCYRCGSEEPFIIQIVTTVKMYDDGSELLDTAIEWDDQNYCECCNCHYYGTVGDFRNTTEENQDG